MASMPLAKSLTPEETELGPRWRMRSTITPITITAAAKSRNTRLPMMWFWISKRRTRDGRAPDRTSYARARGTLRGVHR
jgi:hypothetical protein